MKTTRPFSFVRPGQMAHRVSAVAVAALACAIGAESAQAFEFDTGNPDLTVRWDNTPRVNLGMRVEKRNDQDRQHRRSPTKAPTASTRATWSPQRLDWLTELDIIYQKRFGGRISAAGLVRRRLRRLRPVQPQPAPRIDPQLRRQQVHRLHAIACTTARTANSWTPSSSAASTSARCRLTVKLGRHSLYWGESLFLGGNLNSIAYAQNPLDLQKGFATPGAEAKELFRPLNQISAQAAVTDDADARWRSTSSSGSRSATPKAAPTSARSTSPSTARSASSCSALAPRASP